MAGTDFYIMSHILLMSKFDLCCKVKINISNLYKSKLNSHDSYICRLLTPNLKIFIVFTDEGYTHRFFPLCINFMKILQTTYKDNFML